MSVGSVEIAISKQLYDLVAKYVESSGGEFASVREFVEFVLRESLNAEGAVYTEEEEKGIQERLKGLGYL